MKARASLAVLFDTGANQIGEEMVVTPPAAYLVQRHQEQPGPLYLLEQRLTVATAGHRVAQRARQPLQHRGLEQEARTRSLCRSSTSSAKSSKTWRWLPVNPARARPHRLAPQAEAASCSPAAHPSVRATRAAATPSGNGQSRPAPM